MRLYCILFLATSFALCAIPARADDAAPIPAADLYKRAVKNLDAGYWFESAITDLTEAVRQEPTNSDYHLALGCAEVDRAGSLAYAAFMTDQLLNDQAQYSKDFAAWRTAQTDPKSDDYGQPAPTPPPVGMRFQTKDDTLYLRLTGKEAAARIIALGLSARKEWAEAVRLAKSPEDKAQAESVQGWGLQYERNLLTYTGYASKHIPGAPTQADVTAAFAAATQDDPANAAYWEGLGNSLCGNTVFDESSKTDALRTWQKSLALNPGNIGLRARLLNIQMKSDPKAALETAKKLSEADISNSYVQYAVAALLFKQVHYGDVRDRYTKDMKGMTSDQLSQRRNEIAKELAAKDDAASEQIASDALAAIKRGNRGIRYEIPTYTPPVPKILWHAWGYWSNVAGMIDFSNSLSFAASLRELARAAGGYAIVAANRGDISGGARAARACIGIGQKLEGDWPVKDKSPADDAVITVMIGVAVQAIGHADLQKVYQIAGDGARAAQAEAEATALKQRMKIYAAAVGQSLQDNPTRLYESY